MHLPSPIEIEKNPPCLDQVDMEKAVIKDKDDYENELKKQQKDLSEVQQAYYHQGRRAIVVFQGWDASGKGGAIRRITEKLDPRGYQVYPISAPTPEEQGKHYLYRFQNKLPAKGTIAIFDRSWYGRVMVERIEGYAKDTEWQRAYQEINEFERMLTDDGVRIIKMFLHITPEEQLKRFSERLHNPQKQWKLTLDDIRNRDKWPEYENAINDMFRYTSTETSPWHTVAANHKWYARVETLKIINKAMREGVDVTPPPLDDALIKAAEEQLGIVYKG